MARILRFLLFAALVALLASPLWLAALALHDAALVAHSEELTPEDVERALRLAHSHDPRRALPGIVRTLRLTPHEAEVLLNHAAARVVRSRWKVGLQAGRLRVQGSVAVPANAFGRWLNVEAVFVETPQLPRLESFRLGRLALPPWLVREGLVRGARWRGIDDEGILAALTLRQVRFAASQVLLAYAWSADAPARVVAALLPPQEHERLRRYAAHLADYTARGDAGRARSLSELLPPMFELARRRSAHGHDAAAENRAALLVLGMVANGVGLETLLPERAAELSARRLHVTLGGRRDSTQHFLVSATLAAENGTPLADVVGLYKELADSRGGSGFSFNDMAANRAGTRFGALAVQEPGKLQARLAAGVAERDFMPPVADLPEFLQQQEFGRRFGGPGAPAYDRMLADIDERIDAAALFR